MEAECEFDEGGLYVIVNLIRGPVAQLGARFHGMEEVDGSNPSRSTKGFKHLPLVSERLQTPSSLGVSMIKAPAWPM